MPKLNPANPLPRCWNVASNGSEAEITFYGDVLPESPRDWWTNEIIEGMYITPETFAKDLEKIKNAARITIKINSLGGDVYTALAIHNALKDLKGHKTVIVEGIAASAASVLAMAGDEIKMYPGSIMMIHGVATMVWAYIKIPDLEKMQAALDVSERAIAAIYSAKTGKDVDELREMMTNETWMTGAEAVEAGFATELLVDDDKAPAIGISNSGRTLLVNGIRHNVAGLSIPEKFHIPMVAMEPTAPAIENQTESVTKGAEAMTREELQAQFPELVNEITQEAVTAAVNAERQRIQEIEEIEASVGDANLINDAKFVNPVNAAQLALIAMKNQAKMGASFIEARRQEQETVNNIPAAATDQTDATALEKADKQATADKIAQLSAQYKEIFK